MRTGASGGDLVKTLQPTEIEALALAFLGVEKLSGKPLTFLTC